MKHLICGYGEVGQALYKVLAEKYEIAKIDRDEIIDSQFDVLHICFPYSKEFVKAVKQYQINYLKLKGLTIVHSTVPIGTSDKISAVHSPIRGIHPHLCEGIKGFVKFFGGERSVEAAKIFADLGVDTITTPLAKDTEAMKLFDTTLYGLNIIAEKLIYDFCKKYGLDFDIVYTQANETYNKGYEKLGHPKFKKYILKHTEGEIGGHCIMSNAKLLDDTLAKFILKQNENFRITKQYRTPD